MSGLQLFSLLNIIYAACCQIGCIIGLSFHIWPPLWAMVALYFLVQGAGFFIYYKIIG